MFGGTLNTAVVTMVVTAKPAKIPTTAGP